MARASGLLDTSSKVREMMDEDKSRPQLEQMEEGWGEGTRRKESVSENWVWTHVFFLISSICFLIILTIYIVVMYIDDIADGILTAILVVLAVLVIVAAICIVVASWHKDYYTLALAIPFSLVMLGISIWFIISEWDNHDHKLISGAMIGYMAFLGLACIIGVVVFYFNQGKKAVKFIEKHPELLLA